MARIYVRAIEPEDLDFFYDSENSQENWQWGSQSNLLSRYDLKRFIESSHQSVIQTGQKRYVVCCSSTHQIIGSIDLFDYNAIARRISAGFIIYDSSLRGQGIGRMMLQWIESFCFGELSLHQIYLEVQSLNLASISLIEKCGYKHCGTKRDWFIRQGKFEDVESYQLISEK